MTRSRLTALVATLALAGAPAAAFGQNAGDDQYEDPFGGDAPSSGSGSPSATPTPAPIQETAPGVGSEPEPGSGSAPASPTPAPSAAAAPGDQLPRTGGEPAAVGLLGVSLVLAGVGLRLRLRPAGLADGERLA
jgi:hypothetical protein